MKKYAIVVIMICSGISAALAQTDDDLLKDVKEQLRREIKADLLREMAETERKERETKAKESRSWKGGVLMASTGVSVPLGLPNAASHSFSQVGVVAQLSGGYWFGKHFGLMVNAEYGMAEVDSRLALSDDRFVSARGYGGSNRHLFASLGFDVRFPVSKAMSLHFVPTLGYGVWWAGHVVGIRGDQNYERTTPTLNGLQIGTDLMVRAKVSQKGAVVLALGARMLGTYSGVASVRRTDQDYVGGDFVTPLYLTFRLGYAWSFS